MLINKRVNIENPTPGERDRMYLLMKQYYENTFRENFDNDLKEKDLVLMIKEPETNHIVGFSTQMLIRLNFRGRDIGVLFSGDPIIEK